MVPTANKLASNKEALQFYFANHKNGIVYRIKMNSKIIWSYTVLFIQHHNTAVTAHEKNNLDKIAE